MVFHSNFSSYPILRARAQPIQKRSQSSFNFHIIQCQRNVNDCYQRSMDNRKNYFLKLFCNKLAVKLIAIYLLLKLQLLFNENYKTSRIKIAAKTVMNLPSSLMKVKYNRGIFSHESFRKSFKKS